MASPPSKQATSDAGVSSTATSKVGQMVASGQAQSDRSTPNSNRSTPRSPSSSQSTSSPSTTPRSVSSLSPPGASSHSASKQKFQPKKHGGHHRAAASNEPPSELQSRLQNLNVSAQAFNPSTSPSDILIQPSVPGPSVETSTRNTKALPKEVIDHLPPTFRKFALKDKVALVTGGARGLGLHMSQGLCESGIKALAIFDIQPALGETVARSLRTATGIPIDYYNVDVTKEKNVEAAVCIVVKKFGGIDILINSAGVAFSNLPAESHPISVFQRTIDINLVGSFCIARAVAKQMIAATPGTSPKSSQRCPDRSIIFIASMSGSIVNFPQPQCAYNASKAGVIQLSKCLAAEWARYGIRVNTLSPGYMDTELNRTPALSQQKSIWRERTPLKRLGEIDELNNAVLWLAGEGARFCTGADVKLDGGYSIY